MPATFVFQCISSVCLLLVGTLALAVSGRMGHARERHRAGWRLVGASFTLHGGSMVVQNGWGGVALGAGDGSAAMAAYARALPAFNHGRGVLVLALCAALSLLAVRRGPPGRRFWWTAGALLVGGLLAGTAVGVAERDLDMASHLGTVAVWGAVELVALFAALFLLLVRRTVDRHLWAMLAVYSCSLALGAFWIVTLGQRAGADAWSPPTWSLHALYSGLALVMLGVVLRRRVLARRYQDVPAMLDAPWIPPPLLP